MTVIDPSTDIGKLRLRCGDFGSLTYLPDSVYSQTLADNAGNLPNTAKICATYILGMLAFKTHRKLATLEVFGNEAFKAYKEYLVLITKDPAFMDISPIPYSSTSEFSTLQQFQSDWNNNYYSGTQSQQLAVDASVSPNDGSLYGALGTDMGWNTV